MTAEGGRRGPWLIDRLARGIAVLLPIMLGIGLLMAANQATVRTRAMRPPVAVVPPAASLSPSGSSSPAALSGAEPTASQAPTSSQAPAVPDSSSPKPVTSVNPTSIVMAPSASPSPAEPPFTRPSGYEVPDVSNNSGPAFGYDSKDGYPLLVQNAGPGRDATWRWDGTGWLKTAPSARVYTNLVYDPEAGVVIGLGGTGNLSSGTTWGWDGSKWSELGAGPSVDVRDLTYDESRHAMYGIAWNGLVGGGVTTWAYKDSAWSQAVTSTAPPGHVGMAFQYDPRSAVSILTGGLSGTGAGTNSTWAWDGTAWTELHPAHSPGGGLSLAAYSDVTQQLMLQQVDQRETAPHTWLWGNGDWREVAVPYQTPTWLFGLVFDTVHGYFLHFSAPRQEYTLGSETWTFATGAWTRRE